MTTSDADPTYHPNPMVQQYLQSLSEKEMAAYLIAKNHLGSSFSIEKSNGYLKWLKTATAADAPIQKPL